MEIHHSSDLTGKCPHVAYCGGQDFAGSVILETAVTSCGDTL